MTSRGIDRRAGRLGLAAVSWLLACALLAGCQTRLVQEFPFTKFKAENMLETGIRQYDDGNYKLASRTIQGALDAGLTTRSQGRAYKYLAFIHCVSGQQNQCRDDFHKALAADPRMELKPEEAGHPLWGPVFQAVKASTTKP
jgi:Tfp pilus assembly protein PilF